MKRIILIITGALILGACENTPDHPSGAKLNNQKLMHPCWNGETVPDSSQCKGLSQITEPLFCSDGRIINSRQECPLPYCVKTPFNYGEACPPPPEDALYCDDGSILIKGVDTCPNT